MESGHRFDAQTLHSFIQAVFRQMGSEEQEAKLVADHLIAANLAGHDSHGIGMIPSYVRSWSQGHLQINHHAKIVKEAGAAVTLDGDRAFGQVAAHFLQRFDARFNRVFIFVVKERHIDFCIRQVTRHFDTGNGGHHAQTRIFNFALQDESDLFLHFLRYALRATKFFRHNKFS